MDNYCRMGNFRSEYDSAILISQAKLPQLNSELNFCNVIKEADI